MSGAHARRFVLPVVVLAIALPALIRRSVDAEATWAAFAPVAAQVTLGAAALTLLAAVVAGVWSWRHA